MQHDSEYQGPDRRRAPSRAEIADMVAEELDVRLAATETNLINHINVKIGQLDVSLSSKLTKVVNEAIDKHVEDAFPPGPLHLHKAQHQKHIDAAANTKRIWMDIQLWAIRGVLLFVFGLLVLGSKEWLLRELAK